MQVRESASDVVAAAGQAGPSADAGLHGAQRTVRKRWLSELLETMLRIMSI